MNLCCLSSRRRHTRYWRDWSSDVCSSDLEDAEDEGEPHGDQPVHAADEDPGDDGLADDHPAARAPVGQGDGEDRSEARRVGKECRSRLLPYHYIKKVYYTQLILLSRRTYI